MTLGVGVLGAGAGVSALHLPILAAMTELFRVVHVADSGSGRAEQLANRFGARHSSGTDSLLADPDVEVVVIASPPEEHVRHVLACVEAGIRGIICEKPLGLTTAEIAEAVLACRNAGTALVIGTHHLHDPGWELLSDLIREHGVITGLTVTVAIPPNIRYHQFVTETAPGGGRMPTLPESGGNPRVAADSIRALLLGPGIHDVPLLRRLLPNLDEVVYARGVPPWGYAVGLIAGGVPVQLTTVLCPDGADVLWRVSITTDQALFEIDFPPSFVQAGSATVRVKRDDGTTTEYPRDPADGYSCEWRLLARLVCESESTDYEGIQRDAEYAVRLADEAHAVSLEGSMS